MRADSAGARTWLLGAVALWALCAWLLALFGLGGRVDRLAEDPSLLPKLPEATKPPPERLGPLPQYAEIGRRPLFAEDRKPHPFFINPEGEDDGKGGFDFVLTSVITTPGFQMAILQPSGGGDSVRVKLGDAPESAAGWTLASLDARSAVFNGPDGERKLELRVFDGQGGQPPTPMAAGGRLPPQGGMPEGNVPAQPGGMDMAAPKPGAAAPPAPTPPPPSPPDKNHAAQPNTSESQIEAIRKRIEARRAQLRQEQQQPPPPPKP